MCSSRGRVQNCGGPSLEHRRRDLDGAGFHTVIREGRYVPVMVRPRFGGGDYETSMGGTELLGERPGHRRSVTPTVTRTSSEDLITLGFVNTPQLMALLEATPKLADLDLHEYDAIMIAGGLAPMFTYRDRDDVHEAIRHFYESEKPTAIYCHGTAALVDLKLSDGSYLVDGKTVTGFSNREEDHSDAFVGQTVMPFRVEDLLKQRGANYVQGASSKPSPSATADYSPASSNTQAARSPSC